MDAKKAVCLAGLCGALATWSIARAEDTPSGKLDGIWNTHVACEAHGEMPAYAWDFPSTIKAGIYHGQHSEQGQPGYLVIDGPIGADGSAKLEARGTVTQSHAHGVFALKGNNYTYTIKGQFTETTGSGKRDEGVGILGRACAFEFKKQAEAVTTPSQH